MSLRVACAMLVLLWRSLSAAQPAPVAPSPEPKASRLFGEVALGVGRLTLAHDSTTSSHTGIASSLALGGFVAPRVALGARFTGLRYSIYEEAKYEWFVGPQIQIWIVPQVFIGAGLGLAMHGCCPDGFSFGQEVRAGFAPRCDGRGVTFAVEVLRDSLGFACEYCPRDFAIWSFLAEVGFRAF